MGWVEDHVDASGARVYYARYRDRRGVKQTVPGTFTLKRDAINAYKQAEVRIGQGGVDDPRRARQSFEYYVIEQWLPNHIVEASTLEGYTYQINKHLIPWFGPMRLIDITPADVREWIGSLIADGLAPKTIKNLKNQLSGIFTTALNDQIIHFHPCQGVKTPPAPRKPLQIITPEQFDILYDHLPDAFTKLMVETDIETGLRWGELTELRVKDFHQATGLFTISRAVVEVDAKFHPEGKNFLVKEYPKDREARRVDVTEQLRAKLVDHIAYYQLTSDDLLFRWSERTLPAAKLTLVPNPDELGYTEPNENGRRYRHGTTTAYNAGKCRCRHCKDAFALYRARRRDEGKDAPRRPRQRHVDADGHIPNDWFRVRVWKPALTAANIRQKVRVHDLRHAHASWLVAGGVDLQRVKERLGHESITTVEQYLHTLPDVDRTTVNAFANIRNRSRG